jgi:hypothetical protein
VLCVFSCVLTVWHFFDRVLSRPQSSNCRQKSRAVSVVPTLGCAWRLFVSCVRRRLRCVWCVEVARRTEDVALVQRARVCAGVLGAELLACVWRHAMGSTSLLCLESTLRLMRGCQLAWRRVAPLALSLSHSLPSPSSGRSVTDMHTHALPFAGRWLSVVPLS